MKVAMLYKRLKQKTKISKKRWQLTGMPVLTLATLLTVGIAAVPAVQADQFDQQINALQQKNAAAAAAKSALQITAATYQDAISQLQSQIDQIQAQINQNVTEQQSLQQQIADNEAKLDSDRATLGQDIKTMYVDGTPSTLEMLASSGDLSTFVDKEEYRTTVQNKIEDTVKEINVLQAKLRDQKDKVDALLNDERSQQSTLDSKRADQANLLAMNEQQQANYTAQLQDNAKQIAQLRQQQILANLSGASGIIYGGVCGGGPAGFPNTYPASLCNAGQDSIVDPWGLYNRECVSYVAWKEYEAGRYVPYGLGNAGDWPAHVPSSWIDGSPQVGDAAVRPANPNLWFGNEQDVGHVMFVEAINGDGTIAISQYNANLNGQYSFVAQKSTAGLIFIHFPSQ
ncbi:MAG TPA: CHAP domain-containing protein [Candidatus Saccharimonadales bacterium]|nr:CHAP domain-containing protein [Candidatus Saccharimonadales bacterium]